jgi:hypothetical protein
MEIRVSLSSRTQPPWRVNNQKKPFDDVFAGRDSRRFFLDAACGAQPRTEYGKQFRYHVCVDFSLDDLQARPGAAILCTIALYRSTGKSKE